MSTAPKIRLPVLSTLFFTGIAALILGTLPAVAQEDEAEAEPKKSKGVEDIYVTARPSGNQSWSTMDEEHRPRRLPGSVGPRAPALVWMPLQVFNLPAFESAA